MSKHTLLLSSSDLLFERDFPSGFGETPLRSSSFRLSRDSSAEELGQVSQEDMVTLLGTELTRVRAALSELPADSLLRKCGLVDPSIGGFRSPGDGMFSPLDSLPLAFLQLSSWGKYIERDGILSYVPTPAEFLSLLSGEGVSPPPPPRDSKNWAKDYSFAIPAVRSVSISEAEAFLGARSVLLAGKFVGSDPQFEGQGEERRLVFGDPGLDSGQALYQGAVRSILRDLAAYGVYDRYAVATTDAKGRVYLGPTAGGATRVLDVSVWKTVLPALVSAWEARTAVMNDAAKYPWYTGHRRDNYPVGAFRIDELSFGVAPTSVTEKQVSADLETTVASIRAARIESWSPEKFVFFLRQLDLNLLSPLGLVGKSGDFPKGSVEVGLIRGWLKAADQGECHSAMTFFARFPGKAAGFESFLADAYSLGSELVQLDRSVDRQLPRSAFYELPFGGKADHKAYLERSLSVERGISVFTDSPSRPVQVTFPTFSTAIRRLSSLGFRWPELRGRQERDSEDKPLTWGQVAKTLGQVPCKDPLVQTVRDWVLTREPGEPVSEEFETELGNYLGDRRIAYEAGMLSDLSTYSVDTMLRNNAFSTAKLSSIGAVLAGEPSDRLGTADFVFAFRAGLPKDDEGGSLLSRDLLAFPTFDPLSFDRSKDLVVLSQGQAEREVFGWVLRHPEAIKPAALSVEGEALAKQLVASAKSALAVVGRLPLPEDFDSILTRPTGQPPKASEERAPGAGRWTETLMRMSSTAERTRLGAVWDEGASYMDALAFLREAPLSMPPNAESLSEYDRLFLSRVIAAETPEAYVAALKDEGFFPEGYLVDRPEWVEAIASVLASRVERMEKSRWSAPMVEALALLHPVSLELSKQHPYLLHTPEFSSFHPSTLRGTADALLQAVKENRSAARFSYSLARLKADLTRIQNDPEMVRSFVARSEAVARDSARYVELLTREPLYSGLITDVVSAPSADAKGRVVLSGVGGVYYTFLNDAFPNAGKEVDCELECRPGAVPAGLWNDVLKLDLSGSMTPQVEMFRRHRLFALRSPVEDRTLEPLPADLVLTPEKSKGPAMAV